MRSPVLRGARYTVLIMFVVLVLMPAYVLLVTSFKTPADTSVAQAWSLPETWTLDPWRKAWASLSPSLGRSFALAVPAALVSSVIGAANGFVLSLWRFRGADVVFTFMLFGMFIPYQAVMIPLRQTVAWMGLPTGIPTLIFVHVVYGLPICTLIFRNYFATTLPGEIIEAAHVDGAGLARILLSIAFPLAIPGFVVTIIWQFTSVWNDYLFAIFLANTRNGPVTIALNALAGGQLTDYSASMAGAMIASLPTLLVYVVLGRWFVSGLMAGSVKS